MVEITFQTPGGVQQTIRVHGKNATSMQQRLTDAGVTVIGVAESYAGEIEDAEAMQELKNLLPKLRQVVAKLLPVLIVGLFILRKLHLVRPDLIPYPLDWPVYA